MDDPSAAIRVRDVVTEEHGVIYTCNFDLAQRVRPGVDRKWILNYKIYAFPLFEGCLGEIWRRCDELKAAFPEEHGKNLFRVIQLSPREEGCR